MKKLEFSYHEGGSLLMCLDHWFRGFFPEFQIKISCLQYYPVTDSIPLYDDNCVILVLHDPADPNFNFKYSNNTKGRGIIRHKLYVSHGAFYTRSFTCSQLVTYFGLFSCFVLDKVILACASCWTTSHTSHTRL